jgi:hypothetical protein
MDTELATENTLAAIATDAIHSINEAYDYFLVANSLSGSEDDIECELYLYVSYNGDWIIDHAQYFTGFSGGILSAVPIGHYYSSEQLFTALLHHADGWY